MQQQLLQQLRDVHEPEAISWWPLAFGWWILLLICIAMLAGLVVFLYQRHKRDAYRREALETAQQCFTQYQLNESAVDYLEQMNQLLRRVLLKISPDQNIAEISGENWVSALNAHAKLPLSEQASDALAIQLYKPHPQTDILALNSELTDWIRNHRRVAHA